MLFANILRQVIREGTLRYVDSRGRTHVFGNGGEPRSTIRLHERFLNLKIALNPALKIPEAYLDGQLTIEEGDLFDFLNLLSINYKRAKNFWLTKLGQKIWLDGRNLKQFNPVGKAKRNIAHHYDLSDALYEQFLDPDRQYSCAYFTNQGDTIEAAQQNKKHHIAAKMLLKPGQKVLDIGCGWGGLGLYLAGIGGLDVTGVTLSEKQQKTAVKRAKLAGLDQYARFLLEDYRQQTGPYDRIVSVGMFEHVGKKNYREFFDKVSRLMTDDGVMLLHSIGRFNCPSPINPFIRKYIFPGADLPTLSETLTVIEESGLYVTDIEILRLHYAETLRLWRERFEMNRNKIAAFYDEQFCRMWEIYLIICELGFRRQDLMVFQIQLSRKMGTVPLTRDYITKWEQAQMDKGKGRGVIAA